MIVTTTATTTKSPPHNVMAGLVPAIHHPASRKMVSRDPFHVFIAVYMMANTRHGTIYIGVTSFLPKRVSEHREGLIDGFTKRYGLHKLVWYEAHDAMPAAIQREKTLKKYPRDWKTNLIDRENPEWHDLFPALVGMHRTTLKEA